MQTGELVGSYAVMVLCAFVLGYASFKRFPNSGGTALLVGPLGYMYASFRAWLDDDWYLGEQFLLLVLVAGLTTTFQIGNFVRLRALMREAAYAGEPLAPQYASLVVDDQGDKALPPT